MLFYRLRKVSIAFSSDSIASRWVWGPVIAKLTSLTFDQCPITDRDFVRILSHCVQKLEMSSLRCKDQLNSDQEMKLENNYPVQSSNLR